MCTFAVCLTPLITFMCTRGDVMTVWGYCRVSTDLQDNERQQQEVERYAAKLDLAIGAWCRETVSSKKTKREIYKLIDNLHVGDVIITDEFSRLSRGGMIELSEIIGNVQKVKADLHIANGGYVIKGDGPMDYGMESIVFALGLAARIERDMISHRTKTGMAAKKALGYPDGKAGRPEGYRKLDGKREEITDLLKIGVTKLKVAERYGVSRVTLNRFIA
jgi:DNA invertase Pin-like site-specific DNA recombinase